MKKIIFLKGMLSVVMLFIASLTISAAKPGDNLVHNTEEVNGPLQQSRTLKRWWTCRRTSGATFP